MRLSGLGFVVSIGLIIYGCWLTKDAHVVMKGGYPVSDSSLEWVFYLGISLIAPSCLLRLWEDHRSQLQRWAREEAQHREDNIRRLVQWIKSHWSAELGIPQ